MIIDRIENAEHYYGIHARAHEAFQFLTTVNLSTLEPGNHAIDGENLFAIVQIYETLDAENEEMESHKKYIDVQYMVKGEELVGHDILNGQPTSKPYDEAKDFALYAHEPSFFSKLKEGMFMVFFPTDLHMPCIQVESSAFIKKVVIKIKI